jgi:hypothetical protein
MPERTLKISKILIIMTKMGLMKQRIPQKIPQRTP